MSDTSPIEAIFGGCPVEVQLYDDAGATGDLIDGTRLASLTIHRGRQNATDRVEAGTFSFTLTGGLNEAGDVVELGRRLRIRLAAGVIDAALPGLDASAHPRITGLVTDVGDVDVTPTASAAVAPVAGVSLAARLLSYELDPGDSGGVGDGEMNVIFADLEAAWRNDPGLWIEGWGPTGAAHDEFPFLEYVYPSDAVANPPNAHPNYSEYFVLTAGGWPENSTPADDIALASDSTRGEFIDRRDGRPDFRHLDNNADPGSPANLSRRASAATPIIVDVSQVIAPLRPGKHLSDVLNRVVVSRAGGATSTRTNQPSIDKLGRFSGEITTNRDTAAEAQAIGDAWLAALSRPRFTISELNFDLGKLYLRDAAGDRDLVAALLTSEIADLVELAGALPATSPIAGGRYWIVGVDETYTRTAWTMRLAVVPYEYLAPAETWAELGTFAEWAGVTWNDVPADLSWRYFGAFLPT